MYGLFNPVEAKGQLRMDDQDRIGQLESRVAALESDRDRFLKALRGAVEMLLENPMATAMMPKQMKEDLKRYVQTAN